MCSEEDELQNHLCEMRLGFKKIAFLDKILNEELSKPLSSDRGKHNNKKIKGVPFVVTYHPMLQELDSINKGTLLGRMLRIKVKISFHLDPWFRFAVLEN